MMDLSKFKPDSFIIKTARAKGSIAELLAAIKKGNRNSSFAQVFDPESTVDRTHLIGAYANALLAFNDKTNKTDSMAMEMLLFAAMTDQIERAISVVGAKDASGLVLFCSDRAAFGRVKVLVTNVSEFKPSASHIKSAALQLGLMPKKGENVDALILEGIAVSRLDSN